MKHDRDYPDYLGEILPYTPAPLVEPLVEILTAPSPSLAAWRVLGRCLFRALRRLVAALEQIVAPFVTYCRLVAEGLRRSEAAAPVRTGRLEPLDPILRSPRDVGYVRYQELGRRPPRGAFAWRRGPRR